MFKKKKKNNNNLTINSRKRKIFHSRIAYLLHRVTIEKLEIY